MRSVNIVLYKSCLASSFPRYFHFSARALGSLQNKIGHAGDDALGAEDPLAAVDQALKGETRKEQILPEDIDPVASAVNRRRNRRKRSMDSIFGDVLHDALRLRDMGKKPDADFVYKRTQERIYEEEYGHKPSSAKDKASKYVPFPPDLNLNRLIPLEDVVGDDPWPERAITAQNPVWTRHQVERDRVESGGAKLKALEKKMFAPRDGFDQIGEFMDAIEELAHWEERFVKFIREAPLSQRRTLPYLHEFYRFITHRLVRAEKRYICTRDAALAKAHASPSVYKMTEDAINFVRALYSETHRSLSSPNYDPVRMKKSTTGALLQMTGAEFEEWKRVKRHQRNRLVAEIA